MRYAPDHAKRFADHSVIPLRLTNLAVLHALGGDLLYTLERDLLTRRLLVFIYIPGLRGRKPNHF